MEHFSTFREYARFAMAREFIYADPDKGDFRYHKNKIERLGDFLVAPLFSPSDKLLSNIRNPALIASLTALALFANTAAFYPSVVEKIFSYTWLLHDGSFYLSTATILGLGMRTLGRLHPLDNDLMQAWDKKELIPVPLGAEFIRIPKQVT